MSDSILRGLRKKKGLSLRSFCEENGYKDPVICSIERCKRMTWSKIQNELAAYYGVSPSTLFDLETGIALKVEA